MKIINTAPLKVKLKYEKEHKTNIVAQQSDKLLAFST